MNEPDGLSSRVVLLSEDLMFASRLEGAARAAGVELRVVRSPDAALDECGQAQASLLLLDLGLSGLEVSPFVTSLRETSQSPVRIVAYAPHVHTSKLQAAAEAGCDEVLTRGQFHAQMNDILVRQR